MDSVLKTKGLYEHFLRKGKLNTRTTHYCAGCGHGIVHKLIGEAMVELGIQDQTIFISPVGCVVFGYYYMDCGNIQVAHGRAPAVGTGISRTLKDKVVISYQGDGDLAAIGFNSTFQAANRGENIAVFFINNAIYGMTGGQMAPTTLIGQKTTTSPWGRDPLTAGYPVHVCEILNQLKAPIYIERVSVADSSRIVKARHAIRKALQIQRDRKGYSFVEIIAPCPTNTKGSSLDAMRFCIEQMEKEYPLGCLRDRSAESLSYPPHPQRINAHDFFPLMSDNIENSLISTPEACPIRRFKFSGFGGQGILSLGLIVAKAAQSQGKFVSWLPSYGPEQRGGAAACSVIISDKNIGSPLVNTPDILVTMNQPSYERFAPSIAENGTIIYDSHIPNKISIPSKSGIRQISFPAMELANQHQSPKSANTALLGAITELRLIPVPKEVVIAFLKQSFKSKKNLVEKNLEIFHAALQWVKEHNL